MLEATLIAPELKSFAGRLAENFPDGFKIPYQILVREAWVNHRKKCIRECLFTIPGFGTLHMRGRDYVFTPLTEYAKEKGYPAEISGVWT